MFLDLLRQVAADDPELGRRALKGLRRYQQAPLSMQRRERPVLYEEQGVTLRNCGGRGPTLLLVPSLINPPTILDLDPDCSVADVLATKHRVLLLDWGPAAKRADLSLDDHVAKRLVPLLEASAPAILLGYCLGGTLALAAARAWGKAEAVVTLASPYRFDAYPVEARKQLQSLWRTNQGAATQLGFLPMEVLQAAFWQADPGRIVTKFARFAEFADQSPEAKRFVTLEDWANGGEPLPIPAAIQLVEQLFGKGETLSELPSCPMLHVTAAHDRIAPATTVAPGEVISSASGHVGMIVGREAPARLHAPLLSWLEGAARSR